MYQWVSESLGNVSVNRKLGLGFGLVLLLTLAITLTGWMGMDSIINRGDKLGNISVIYGYTQDLRIARQHYQRQPDQASINELDQALNNVERQVTLMLGQIEQASDHQRLQQQLEAIRSYRQAFSELKQSPSEQVLQRMADQGSILLQTSQAMTLSQTKVRDEGARQAKAMLAGATGLAMLLGLLAAWAITRQIIIPLRQTLAAAERVANGDLRQDLQTTRRDELGQLQASMQRMTQGLRELIGGIGDGVTQIASAAEELSAVTEQTSAGVNNQKVETDRWPRR